MNITILNVAQTTAFDKNQKPYQILDVAFKNNTFQGKVEGKKITSYSAAFATLATATSGQSFDIDVEKKNGFNEWVKVVAAGAAPVAAGAPQAFSQAITGKVASAAPRSTYETPEERAKKQVYIVRQSSITAAVSTLSLGAKSLKPEDVIEMAKKYESYVFDEPKLGGATGFADFPDVPDEFQVT